MNKLYIITDTHFNWQKGIDNGWRPEGFQETIIDSWNSMIDNDDTVIHLGDVVMERKSELGKILSSLNGKKILVKGNHDTQTSQWYMSKGFSHVFNDILWIDYDAYTICLSHRPVDMECLMKGKKYDNSVFNIHGHFHNNCHAICDMESEYPWYDVNRNFLLSLEWCSYKPMEMNDFIDKYTNIIHNDSNGGVTKEYSHFCEMIKLNKITL